MTTEKDAMALAVLEQCARSQLPAINQTTTEENQRRAIQAVAHLAARLGEQDHLLTNAGVCELAARNVNVRSYMEEWEARATRAEAELAAVLDAASFFARSFSGKNSDKLRKAIAAVDAARGGGDV